MPKIAHIKREQDQNSAVAERNAEQTSRDARATVKAGVDVARESVQVAADATHDLYETTRQMAKESPEFGHAFTGLLQEQTRQSMATLSTFARAVNWTDVAQAQSKFITDSIQRISAFNARYGESMIRGMTAITAQSRR